MHAASAVVPTVTPPRLRHVVVREARRLLAEPPLSSMLAILAVALAGCRYSLTQQGNMAFELDRYTVRYRFDQRGRFRADQTDELEKIDGTTSTLRVRQLTTRIL